MAQDNVKRLYQDLKGIYNVGTEDEFRAYISDADNREALRQALESDYEVGDSATFSRDLGFGAPEPKSKAASGYVYRQTANGDLVPEEEAAKTNKTAVDTAGTTAARATAKPAAQTAKPKAAPSSGAPANGRLGRGERPMNAMDRLMAARQSVAPKDTRTPYERAAAKAQKKSRQYPVGFGELDLTHGTGDLSNGVADKPEEFEGVERVKAVGRALKGDEEAMKQVGMDKAAAQMKDQLDYTMRTGEMLRDPMKSETGLDQSQMGFAPTVARDEEGNVILGENGKPIIGSVNDRVRANVQNQMEAKVDANNIDNRIADAEAELAEVEAEEREVNRIINKRVGGGTLTDEEKAVDTTGDRSATLRERRRELERLVNGLKVEKNGGEQGFWQGLIGAFNRDNLSFGLSKLSEAERMYSIARKQEQGIDLTDDDKRYLQRKMESDAQDAQNEENSTFLYRAGRQTGEMIPFMLGIAATGGFEGVAQVGADIGARGAASFAARYGADTMGKRAASWVIKNTGVFLGDMAAGYVSAATVGGMGTAADILERRTGDLTTDAEGNYVFEGGENWVNAVFKGSTAGATEYATELSGGHGLWGLGDITKRVMKLGGLGRVSRILSGLEGRAAYKGMQKVFNSMGIQDIGGEVMEEELGILLNSALTGDNTLRDLVDPKIQGDIIGGMALSIGAMKFPGYVIGEAVHGANKAINYAGYHMAKRSVDRADHAAASALGDEWEALRERIDNTPNEEMSQVYAEVMKDEGYFRNEKAAISDYMAQLMILRGYNLASAQAAREAVAAEGTDEAPQAQTPDEQLRDGVGVAVMQANEEGYQTTDATGMQDAENDYSSLRQQLEELVGEEFLQELDDDPAEALATINDDSQWGDNPWTDEEKKLASDYVEAHAKRGGVAERVRDDIQEQVTQAEQEVDARTHKDGSIHPVTVGEEPAYVIDGEVVMSDDGQAVDMEATRAANGGDGMVIIRDAEGKPRPIDASEISSAEAPISAEEEKRTATEAVRQEMAQAAVDKMNGVVPNLQPGDTYELTDGSGQSMPVEIIEANGDGTYHAVMGGTEYEALDLQALSDQMAEQRVEARRQAANTTVVEGSAEGQTAADAAGTVAQGAEETALNSAGTAAAMEGAQQAEQVGQKVGQVGQEVGQLAREEGVRADVGEAMPMTSTEEDAEPDFVAATPAKTREYLYNESGLDAETADQFVANKIAEAEAAAEKASEGKPVIGTNLGQYKKAMGEWQARKDAADAVANYWRQVRDNGAEVAAANETTAERPAPQASETSAETAPESADTTAAEAVETMPREAEEAAMPSEAAAEAAPVEGAQEARMSTQTEGAAEAVPEGAAAVAEGEDESPAEARENRRMRRVREHADNINKKYGANIRVVSSIDEVTNAKARQQLEKEQRQVESGATLRQRTKGWIETRPDGTDEIVIYAPNISSLRDVEKTFLHEVVAHKGLPELLKNKEGAWEALCDDVYAMMEKNLSPEALKKWLEYPGVNGNTRVAADEFMAKLSEGGIERSLRDKVVAAIRKALRAVGITLQLTNDDILDMLAASAENLRREAERKAKAQIEMETTGTMETAGGEKSTRFSTSSIIEGAGFEVSIDEDGGKSPMTDKDGNVIIRLGDQTFDGNHPLRMEDLKKNERAPLNMMIEDALEIGTIDEARADVIRQKYCDIINLYLVAGLAENGGSENLTNHWLYVGETVFKTIATNGDQQYSYSADITRVCKKNEAVIRTISEMQKRLGYGITPSQIMDIYMATEEAGYQVPCPVCYVFSRYIRNGKYASAAINGMRKYGIHLPGGPKPWTVEEWQAELERLKNTKKQYDKMVAKANADVTTILDTIDKLGRQLMLAKTPEEKASIRKRIEAYDKRYRAALDVNAQQSLTNWIKCFAVQGDNNEQLRTDSFYPKDMAEFEECCLDLRKTAMTIAKYPAIQRLRKSGGSAAGKEITFESNNDFGDIVSGVGKDPKDFVNYYKQAQEATTEEEFNKAREAAKGRFADAYIYAQQQSLRGGQRMWSWSDNIEELMPDVAINLMQMEMLGGALQTYSKQLEGINMVARMGGYVNGSLMAKDNGWQEVSDDQIEMVDGKPVLKEAITETIEEHVLQEDGSAKVEQRERVLAEKGSPVINDKGENVVLIFDDVIGVDPHGRDGKKGLFDMNRELDKAGNIMVGMNDRHIRACLADPRVFFVIPWHSSGQSVHLLNQMLGVLRAKVEKLASTDYTAMQEEKKFSVPKKDGKLPRIPSKVVSIWESHRNESDWPCCIEGGIESGHGGYISDTQLQYRALRDAIFSGDIFKEGNEAMLEQAMRDEFLSQVIKKVHDERGLSQMKGHDKGYIYPYEYWDESTTYDTADINGTRYVEYCRRLGVCPKFSGKWKGSKWADSGNFIDEPGYWKLLIDRRMYGVNKQYQDLTPCSTEGFSADLVDPVENRKKFVVTQVADNEGVQRIADAVEKKETERTGTMPTVDYSKNMAQAVSEYEKTRFRVDETSPEGEGAAADEDIFAQAERIARKMMSVEDKVKGVINKGADGYSGKREQQQQAGALCESYADLMKAVNIAKEEHGYWLYSLLQGFLRAHPEKDFLQRMTDGDRTAKDDLAKELEGLTSRAELWTLQALIKEYRERSYDDYKRSAITNLNKAIEEREDAIASESTGGRSLGLEKTTLDTAGVRDLYRQLETDPDMLALMDKVSALAESIGVQYTLHDYRSRYFGASVGDRVEYKLKYLNSPAYSDQHKAATLLHEMIHSVTTYAIRQYELAPEKLSPEARDGVRMLQRIYDQVRRDSDFNGKYGRTDIYEMVAELSNPEFRELLQKKGLWEQVIEAIKRILGVETQTMLEGASAALNRLLDNYDESAHDLYMQRAVRSKDYQSMKLREEEESIAAEETADEMKNTEATKFRVVDDPFEVARLESEPQLTTYKAMALIDGKLYPPMDSKEGSGKNAPLKDPREQGRWYQADEHPEKARLIGGKWYYTLNKSNGKTVDKVAYNPYEHSSNSMLNDQFKEAQSRPELVVVEVKVPMSEVEGGYQAEKAHDSVGWKPWKAGVIQSKLTGTRDVMLSRWVKIGRIVPDAEVAANIMEQIGNDIDEMPSNVVTPAVRAELEKLGMRFVETDNKGIITEGPNKGRSWADAYNNKHRADKPKQKSSKRKMSDDEIRFRLDEGERVEGISYFSGGGLIEAGLTDVLEPKAGVEYDPKIAGVYRDNHGNHIVTADVRDVDPTELAKRVNGPVQYFHASPVCKNASVLKQGGESDIDIETAKATAEAIEKMRPRIVTIENVEKYQKFKAYNIIIDKLRDLGYKVDAHVLNAADYGAATNRKRLIVRAVDAEHELPPLPEGSGKPTAWYDRVGDLIEGLKDTTMPAFIEKRLQHDGIDWRNVDRPLIVMNGAGDYKRMQHAWADEPAPTIVASDCDARIILPGGRVLKVTPRVKARLMGLPDSYKLPQTQVLANTVLGNGVPVELTKGVIEPLLKEVGDVGGGDGRTRFRIDEDAVADAAKVRSLGVPYQGSKNRIARSIVDVLPEGERFVDLFSGGGAMTHAAMLSGKYGSYRMNDINPVGQELFLQGMRGEWKDYDRTSMTEEEFERVKGTPEGLVWSYNGLGRNLAKGEYGRKETAAKIRRVQSLEAMKPYSDRVESSGEDYRNVELRPGDVVYADIPYENTDQTAYRNGRFDKAAFVEWAQQQDVPVYVSEYSMPEGWTEIGSWKVPGMRGGERIEKLFVQDKFADRVADNSTQTRFSVDRFYEGLNSEDEVYDALSEQFSPREVMDVMRGIEQYYGGEIVGASQGAKDAIADGRMPKPGRTFAGQYGEYHHFRIKGEDGETKVVSVPFEGEGTTRFSVSEEEDEVYMDAVERGDMDEARRMVVEAARKMMPNTKVVDEEGIPKVTYKRQGENHNVLNTDTWGSFFSSEPFEDKSFGNVMTEAYLNFENPLVVDAGGESWSYPLWLNLTDRNGVLLSQEEYDKRVGESYMGIPREVWDIVYNDDEEYEYDQLGQIVKSYGLPYDGVIINNIMEGGGAQQLTTDYIALSPNQIKSAEPVTYDDEGKVIPLSERFNPTENDMRFNVDETSLDSEGTAADDEGGGFEEYQPRSLVEAVTKALLELTQKNKNDVTAKRQAMENIAGRIKTLAESAKAWSLTRSAMSQQRAYDQATVDDIVGLAMTLMQGNFIDHQSRGEVRRLLNIIRGGVGKEDIKTSALAVVDLMTDSLLHQWQNALNKQLSVRGAKVDSKGVEVQGRLDIEGQRMISAVREGMGMELDKVEQRLAEAMNDMTDDDPIIRRNAEQTYQGLLIAKQYLEDIKASQEQVTDLKHELNAEIERNRAAKRARAAGDTSAAVKSDQAMRDFRDSVEATIRELKMERVDAYKRLMTTLGGGVEASMERAKEYLEAQREHAAEIQHNANSDLEGVPANEQLRPSIRQRLSNMSIIRFFLKPLANFDYLLRFLGQKSVDGRGYLFNRFMTQWVDANDAEWRNLRAAHKTLDAKVEELFGLKRFSDLFSLERKMPGGSVTIMDGKEEKTYELTAGNLLYMYMVGKMSDGRMKLHRMGITNEDLEDIKMQLDPRMIELADWIQGTFLKDKRAEYNEVYERMFGAPMAAIDNYFPLKINARSRHQAEDVSAYQGDEATPSTTTGSIIKRVKNATPLDIHADAFDVVLEHLQKMEHWRAFAELNRDMNTLLSYKRFRNQIMNMTSLRFGSGETLWQNLKDSFAMAAGTYRPKVNNDSVDKTFLNIAKGVTMAKISLRLYTALKQLLSYPAYLSEASLLELAKTSATPIGWVQSWRWSMENLPGFAERWQSRQAGDSRLMETSSDWEVWKNKIVETASRIGMSPNALVDAWTVAMGSKAIYETARKRYRGMGYSPETAHSKALHDASIAYNETQQSSGAAFLSTMQVDRTIGSVGFTTFRNSSMGYERRFMQALANLKRKLRPGYRAETIEFMAKQMVRDGLNEEQAKRAAKRVYNRSWAQNFIDAAVFGFVLQFAWNLGPYMVYLLLGDDDDEKKDMLKDASMHALAGGVEGLTGGAQWSEIYNLIRQYKETGDAKVRRQLENYDFSLIPMIADAQETLSNSTKGDQALWYDVANLVIQSGIGVNPQTISDGFVALYDYTNGDPKTGMEFALLLCRIAQVPQNQVDMLYIDQLGMFAHDARELPMDELARRWAHYKRLKGAPLSGVLSSDEANDAVEKKYVEKFEKKVKERLEGMDVELLKEDAATFEEHKAVGSLIAKKYGVKDTYTSKPNAFGQRYIELRNANDIWEDGLLHQAWTDAKEAKDVARAKAIDKARRAIRDNINGFVNDDRDEEVMERIREQRRKVMEQFGIENTKP